MNTNEEGRKSEKGDRMKTEHKGRGKSEKGEEMITEHKGRGKEKRERRNEN